MAGGTVQKASAIADDNSLVGLALRHVDIKVNAGIHAVATSCSALAARTASEPITSGSVRMASAAGSYGSLSDGKVVPRALQTASMLVAESVMSLARSRSVCAMAEEGTRGCNTVAAPTCTRRAFEMRQKRAVQMVYTYD